MIDRQLPANPRVRAGSLPQQPAPEQPRHWMHGHAPSFKALARDRQRREQAWAWLSLVVLIVCWDASSRLGERVSPPRARIAHAVAEEEMFRSSASFSVDL
ncbi:hypothetical protein [Steroidobacter cummioxidans]|uniref:hypothetical protein n=1 Tax=Steroidobacter cummioxidans TaxID=1803913 RepID=UPI000E31D9A0|nr:hypothetical protein [Steroidobacter cummioxidans]